MATSLEFTIGGEKYLPLRAVGAVTSGALTAKTVANMIYDYEAYYDDVQFSEVISPVRFRAPGILLTVEREQFKHFTTATGRAPLFGMQRFPLGILVTTQSVKDKFNLVNHVANRSSSIRTTPLWDLSPTLGASDLKCVLEGLPLLRANSAALLKAEILSAVSKIEGLCKAAGNPVDRQCLPGCKKDWIAVLKHLAPLTKGRAPSTLADHFREVGLAWRQGPDPIARATWIQAMRKAGLA